MGQWSGYNSPANQHVAWQRRVVHGGGEGPLRFRAERSGLHWATELPRRLVRPGQLALPLQGIVRVTGVLLGLQSCLGAWSGQGSWHYLCKGSCESRGSFLGWKRSVYCQSPRPSPTPAVRASNSFCVQPVVHDSFLALMPPVLISV